MVRPPFVHPDYWALLGGKAPTPAPPATDLFTIRASINAATQAASNALPSPAGMTTSVSVVTSTDGTEFNVTRFVPLSVQKSSETAQRAVIYGFGGGLIAGSVNISFNVIANFAERTATQVFAPDYRLAPEHPYPAPLQDIYSTITWLQAHAGDFNVDPARIVAFGQSAGGNLMASAALKARDEGLTPPLTALVLAYLGDSNGTEGQGTSNKVRKAAAPYTAAPGRAEDLHGLPPTHLGVGGLDLFRDANIRFAEKLSTHAVKVQFKIFPGVPHGFDGHPAFTLRTELWSNEARFIHRL
ncbi:hypothetical protein PFICI_08681 [Pestalotiopsis fici W106-1]|uniref:Alpha/beta hydrolase fold-3 domain-containing protein n=1 Tax=Pestalotiopsis fici (strain W106-1 / CGMCC3.15140) TaxID=1229662 RepID=W3WY78_PESFW|nr:uncharacterized protein PFICI_08681 [Pestalotiopsis fici W106-1]ETS78828.1 hypothetical protein PFICI_08681 [Pestalotiopsis fici W106-1]